MGLLNLAENHVSQRTDNYDISHRHPAQYRRKQRRRIGLQTYIHLMLGLNHMNGRTSASPSPLTSSHRHPKNTTDPSTTVFLKSIDAFWRNC